MMRALVLCVRLLNANTGCFLNRNAEKELVSQPTELEPGQEWERIAKLCDFNPKASRNSKDVSRMRSIILQLKQNPIPVTGH